MTVAIVQAPYNKLLQLISCDVVGTLSAEDYDILNSFLHHSTTVWVGMEDDKVCGFWGIVLPSLISDRAYLWLHVTPALAEHRFLFIRHSQMFIKNLLEEYPLIVGHCIRGERKSLRWLQWLGATFHHPEGKLVPFEIRAA